ncbi:MAG: phosphate signaling complex protein PhoU [Planctomycetes bacterium]|nr:phosphate signaling complex protein PhoU [Planctomycetota bacterium]MCC7170389.1 phosphate signaling complex protein PhoU [Planctomycetota bacterium]
MSKQIELDLDSIQKAILHIGGLVEDRVDKALTALLQRDAALAREVIDGDNVIDDLELEVEERCLDILALRQPVAKDLRLVTGIMKINSDLERMGDLAVNIAERAEVLAFVPSLPFRPDVTRMASVVKRMTRDGLDAMVRRDEALALRVWEMDDEADRLYRELIGEAIQFMSKNVDRLGDVMHLVGALRNLERIADHATNIAEDVIFVVEGKIVRHRVLEVKQHILDRAKREGESTHPKK